MTRFTLLSFLFLSSVPFTQVVNAQESTRTEQISVSSKESQHGQQLAIVTKKGVTKKGVTKKGVTGSDKPTSLEGTAGKLSKHQAKQLAAPLSKPFDKDLRTSVPDPDFWIYDAFVTFNVDEDFDGYYSTFTVEFDADTVYSEAEVYARLYLTRGSVFEEYHTTSLFIINGDSSTDSFVVESDLLSGFPSGDYELLIELYDGFDDSLVATFDGFNDADLTLLTLESKSFEEVDTVVVVTESGGSFGILALLLIPVLMRRILFTKS
ncbi:MAG: hypothetical protein Alis3KO_12540 [Aliiglaciecola sp.]